EKRFPQYWFRWVRPTRQKTDSCNFLRLLRPSGKAKCQDHTAKDETKELGSLTVASCPLPITYSHLITLSARASTLGGIVRPICLAVCRLITSSNFVGCSTGMSDGFAPLKILSIWTAARRNKSE